MTLSKLSVSDRKLHAKAWLERRKANKTLKKFPKRSKLYKHLPLILMMIDDEKASFQQVADYLKSAYRMNVTRQYIQKYYASFNKHLSQFSDSKPFDEWVN